MTVKVRSVLFLLTLGTLYAKSVEAHRILGYFPFGIFSHQVPFFNVFDQLVSRGHDVTLVSSFPLFHTNPAHYRWVQMPTDIGNNATVDFNPLRLAGITGFTLIRHYSDFCLEALENLVTRPTILNFIHKDMGKYDVIVSEITFCGHIHSALAHKYAAPLVNFHPLGYEPGQFSLLGGSLPPGAVPDGKLPYTDLLSYWERLYVGYMHVLDVWELYHYFLPAAEALMDKAYKYPGSESRPPLLTLLRNISLTLAEYDPHLLGISFPAPPNIKLTGGLHLRPARPLPPSLDQFVAEHGKKGIIFVSLGSILQFTHVERRVLDAFVMALSKVEEYGVIWKLNVNVTLPPHILPGFWFPQEDILGHPLCKLFITHGGIHSSMETIHYSVPALIMPGFSDQFQNAMLMERKGIGNIIPKETITGDSLYLAIREVLQNPKYKAAVQRRSKQMHSLPVRNLDSAVHWIEYVAENQGAPGLRPESRNVNIADLFCFDVLIWALLFLVLVLILLVAVVWCVCCIGRRCRKNCDKED